MDRLEQDDNYADKIKRLQEQLKFEKDDGNKYELQKEIDNLTKAQDKTLTRRGLDDQKADLKAQSDAVKKNLYEQKTSLAKMRDDELAIAEERLDIEVKLLEDELAARKTALETTLESLERNLEAQKAALKKSNDDKIAKAKDTALKEQAIAETSANTIIAGLRAKIAEFANAGASAGGAWASAFADQIAAGYAAAERTAAAFNIKSAEDARNQVKSQVIQLNQTINSQVLSPSANASATKNMMEVMTRNM
jgi:hypothetical protein